jgi:homoserine kinase
MSAAEKSAAANLVPLKLRLPATSANLGPGFDTAGLAMSLYLEIEATAAEKFSINASGRDADLCGKLEDNLVLDTYRDVLGRHQHAMVPIAITMQNQIPLGMGCGSSAAGILAGVAMAAHFGQMGWSREQILDEACRVEGHPDNVAACWLGGMTVAAMNEEKCAAVSIAPPGNWSLLLVLPDSPLATKKARALLPEYYSRADAVFNMQRVALLTAAFASGHGDLLTVAMQDRMHQPYRAAVCPLLNALAPLAGKNGILGLSLSGAGPSVLLVVDSKAARGPLLEAVRSAATVEAVEILHCEPERYPAQMI